MTLDQSLKYLRKHFFHILFSSVFIGVLVFGLSLILLPNIYTANIDMYVLLKSGNVDNPTSLNLDLSRLVANDIIELAKSDRVAITTAHKVGLKNLDDFNVEFVSNSNSRVITLSVSSPDCDNVSRVADAMVSTISDLTFNIMDVESLNVVDDAKKPIHPSGPNRIGLAFFSFFTSFILLSCCVVLYYSLNKKFFSKQEVSDLVDLAILAQIPRFNSL